MQLTVQLSPTQAYLEVLIAEMTEELRAHEVAHTALDTLTHTLDALHRRQQEAGQARDRVVAQKQVAEAAYTECFQRAMDDIDIPSDILEQQLNDAKKTLYTAQDAVKHCEIELERLSGTINNTQRQLSDCRAQCQPDSKTQAELEKDITALRAALAICRRHEFTALVEVPKSLCLHLTAEWRHAIEETDPKAFFETMNDVNTVKVFLTSHGLSLADILELCINDWVGFQVLTGFEPIVPLIAPFCQVNEQWEVNLELLHTRLIQAQQALTQCLKDS